MGAVHLTDDDRRLWGEVVARVLGVQGSDRVDLTLGFAALGGSSLQAYEVAGMARQRLGREVDVARLLGPDRVLDVLADACEVGPAASGEGLAAWTQALLPGQEQMLAAHARGRDAAYHLVFTLDAPRLEPDRVRRALDEVVGRHASLRTWFVEDGDTIRRTVAPQWRSRLDELVLPPGPGPVHQRATDLLVAQAALLPFEAPPWRAVLARGDGEDVLVLLIHHVIADGWSVGILLEDLALAYRSGSCGPVCCGPVSRGQGTQSDDGPGDAAVAASRWSARVSSGSAGDDLQRITDRLSGAPTELTLPTATGQRAQHDGRGRRMTFTLSAEQAAAVERLADEAGVRRPVVLLAAWAAVLARRADVDDLVLGMPVAGRFAPDLQAVVGLLTRVAPVRCRLGGGLGVVEFIRRTGAEYTCAVRDSEVPFDDVVRAVAAVGRDGSNPLAQFAFAAHDQLVPQRVDLGSGEGIVREGHAGGSVFDAILYLQHWGAQPRLCIEYAPSVLAPSTVTALAGAFAATLLAFAAGPTAPLAGVECLSPAESAVLEELAAFDREAAGAGDVWSAFEAVARRGPADVAVSDPAAGVELTYAALHQDVLDVAAALRAQGIQRGDRVLVDLDRSTAEIVTVLAVLCAGATYVGVPQASTDGWRREILRITQSRHVIAGAASANWPDPVRTISPWPAVERTTGRSACAPPRSPDDAVYVSFTSGTTGRPKGIVVPDRAVLRLVRDPHVLRPAPAGGQRSVLRAAPLAFDASTLEVFAPLLSGDRVVVLPPGPATAGALADVFGGHGVTHAWLTAGLFRQVARATPSSFRPLQQILTGGDVVPPGQVRAVLAACPDLWVTNGYGPTENTTFTTVHHLLSAAEVEESVPIGRPIAGTGVLLLGADDRRVPVGTQGELFAVGVGLADGYLQDAQDGFRLVGGRRAYATGDLAVLDPRGDLRFRGRRDRQVKVSGVRVEVAAVEGCLRAWPGVRDAVVDAQVREAGEPVLVAGVVLAEGARLALLADHVEQLPTSMRPQQWAVLPALPLTTNGKVDLAALDRAALPLSQLVRQEQDADSRAGRAPIPPAAQASPPAAPGTAPTGRDDDLKGAVAQIWARLLGHEDFGYDEAFFDVGGTSMQLVEMRDLVRDTVPQARITTIDLYRAGTVNKLTARLREVLRG